MARPLAARARAIVLLLVACAWAAPSSSSAAGLYNVAGYGARAGKPVDAAVEAAYKAAKATGRPATLYFPAGEWTFRRPFLADLDRLTIQGAGRGTTTLRASGAFPPILLGIRRSPAGRTLAAAHRPDAAGKLDFAAPGQFAGYRTCGDAHLGFWASPFDRGQSDGWRSTRKITVDWCSEGGLIGFGMHRQSGPDPWAIRSADATSYAFEFRLADGKYRIVTWKVPGDVAALRRHAVQVDLDAGTVAAYVDDTQVRRATFEPSGPFRPKDYGVFGVGRLGPDLAMQAGGEDHTLYALRLSAGLVYADDGDGTPRRRRDGARIGDGHYFAGTPDLIACVMVDRPEAEGDRLVRWLSGESSGESRTGYGLMLHSGVQSSGTHAVEGTTVRDLTLDLNHARWGQALATGGTIGLTVRDVELVGGWHGLGSAPLGANWPTTLADIKAEGYDASVALTGHSLWAQRLDCGWAGTTALRLEGCSGDIRDVWINGQVDRGEVTIDVAATDEATCLTLEGLRCNQEGLPWPALAAIRITPSPVDRELPAILILRSVFWGNVGPAASLVRLEEGVGMRPCWFELDGASMEASKAGVVTTGPRWRGTVRPIDPAGEKTWIRHDGPGESGVELVGGEMPAVRAEGGP